MENTGMTTMKVKTINKNKVYSYIYNAKSTCKLNISRDLNMGLSTVTQNLKSLEDEGLILKNGFFDSTGGRKADAIEINKTYKISIGVAILKESVDIVAVDLYGNLIFSKTVSMIFEQSGRYFKELWTNIDIFIGENDIPKSSVLGISFAVQGIVSKDGLYVRYGEILSNTQMNLSDLSRFSDFNCRMEHDSKAAASLELWKNPHIENALLLLLNLNMGGAMILNSSVQNGDNMRTGLFEHITMDKNGPPCYCGNFGCLETYCSANALKKASNMDIGRFFDLKTQGNPECTKIWNNYLDVLATAISMLNIVVDGKVIISGYLSWFFSEDDLFYILEKINKNSAFKISRDEIILSTSGNFTQAIGTSLHYIKEFIKNV